MVIFRRRFRFLLGLIFLTIPAFVWSQPYLKRVCLQSNLDDIILYWDQASDPCGKFNNIAIFARPNTTTPFTQIGTVTNSNQTSFVHIGAASITDKWSYQLVYSFLCDDSEFKSDTLFLDFDQPDPSEIDSVSYDPVSGGFFIGWTANPAVDIHGYTLWDNENSNNFEFDNVYGALSYLDTRHDASAGPFAYIMTAFDSCGNQSVISRVHAAPFLSGSTSNCARKIDLSWTPYLGHANVSNEVYLSLDNGDYFRDTLLSGSTNSYSFNIESGQTVDAYVRINLNNGATSRSNPVRFKALDSFSLVSNYLSAVDWVAPNTFELRGTFDNPVTFDSLYIVELTESTPKYHWIDDIDENPYPLQIQVSSDTLSYYFQQILVDRCRRYYPSNLAYNTLLKGTESSVIDEYVLNWNLPRYFD
ncbi:MAG: hypothetical protein LPK45_07960, partial [Bacteroidota bacterium]|nr:hypothetical protein [Bacteroidota bacterium]MDX5431005.1 hypothetical protein [Bacteroidota bacterium]MDX5469756.1 hypothetical protein [Bacteroidota bacterium]